MNFGDICASSYANVGVVGGVDVPVSTKTSRDIFFVCFIIKFSCL